MKILFILLALVLWVSEAFAGAAEIRIQLEQLKQKHREDLVQFKIANDESIAVRKRFYKNSQKDARTTLKGDELKKRLDFLEEDKKRIFSNGARQQKQLVEDLRASYRASRTLLQAILNANLIATNGLACFTRDGKKICFPKKSPD
jgi:hypothetical protein